MENIENVGEKAFAIPIVLITFNRPHLVERQIERLKEIKPKKIFFVSDAARVDRQGERELVDQTRQMVHTIDWPCEVETIYAEQNMGCDLRIVSALDIVFSKVDKAIILEDDCLPCASFFPYCESLLRKYESAKEIMYISGTKWVPDYPMKYSYGFSYNTGTWGWATWSRAWKEWHWDREEWDKNKKQWLKGIYSRKYRYNWIRDMERYFKQKSIPWDYVWRFCVGTRLSIFPAVNLISNEGFGSDATHTVDEEYGYNGETGNMDKLVHPIRVEGDKRYPQAIERQFHIPILYRIRRKLGLLKGKKSHD